MSDSSQPSGSGGIRASDSDREATVLILNKALGDGRINASEHDQRMSAADLQANAGSGMRAMWLSWLGVSVFMIAIWLVGILTSDPIQWQGFWPLWVIVPWGAVILMRTIIDSGNDQR